MRRAFQLLFTPIAFVAAGIGALSMGPSKGTWLPYLPTEEQLNYDMPPLTWATAFHWLKNIAVELVRADPHWWAKTLAFVILVQAILLFLCWRRKP